MSMGLLIKDASGRVVIGPETFTTRFVTSFVISGGARSWGEWFPVAGVRAGMFAVACALGGYNPVFLPHPYGTGWYSRPSYGLVSTLPRMPGLAVGNGWVQAYSPGGGNWDGYVHVLVFTAI